MTKKKNPIDEDLTLETSVLLLRTWATLTALTARDDISLRIAAATSIVVQHIENEFKGGNIE